MRINAVWLGAVVYFASGCTADHEWVTGATEYVQQAFGNQGRYRVASGVAELNAGSVGAIRHFGTIAVPGGYIPPNATCGATFISPHFAVTAFHCVKDLVAAPYRPLGTFLVHQVDVSSVNAAEMRAEGTV